MAEPLSKRKCLTLAKTPVAFEKQTFLWCKLHYTPPTRSAQTALLCTQTDLYGVNDICLVEHNERVEGGHHVLFEEGGGR